MTEQTNGITSETNGIPSDFPLVVELPEGGVASEFTEILMQLATDCSCMGDGILRRFKPSDVQCEVDALMRVVERDYVRRDAINGNPEWIANLKCSAWMGEAHRLERERDEIREERDELEAKYDELLELYNQAEHERCDALMKLDAAETERDELEERVNTQKRTIRTLKDELRDVQYERDKWKARAEQARESYLDAKNARDYWMAMVVGQSKRVAAANRLIGRPDAVDSGETAGSGAAKCGIRDFDDSREKLEDDIRGKRREWSQSPDKLDTNFYEVLGWLDRQAAITERESGEYRAKLGAVLDALHDAERAAL